MKFAVVLNPTDLSQPACYHPTRSILSRLFAVALISALPIFAQVPKKAIPSPAPQTSQTNASVAQCEALKHHGDPDTKNCYQRLALSTDPAVRAEGLWGLGDLKGANEAFISALKVHDKDPNLWTRRGRMFLESSLPADAADWFEKALEIKEDYAPAILGLALVAADGF